MGRDSHRVTGAPQDLFKPLPIKATIDGSPGKLAFFLYQVWAHLDHYSPAYIDDVSCVNAIVTNLEGEVEEWVTRFHNEEAPKLGDPDVFLAELRDQFGDTTLTPQVESDIHAIRQGNRPVAEYIHEFC